MTSRGSGSASVPAPAVPALTASERLGLLSELVRTLQLRRCPMSDTEVRVARLEVGASGSVRPRAWRRMAADLSGDKRSRFVSQELAESRLDMTSNGTEAEMLNAVVGARPSEPKAVTASPYADPEGIAVAPLPLTRARSERLRPMRAGGVSVTSLPVRTEVLRDKPPRRWGRALDPSTLSPEDRQALRDLLEKELSCGAIERVTSTDEIELVTPIYVVRSGGKLRLIHDCRPLNQQLEHITVKYSSVTDVGALRGKLATKIDLENAFKNVGLCEADRKLLCFQLGSTVWRWTTLNFGCAASPALFDRAISPAVAEMRRRGIRFLIYVDDILIVGDTVEELDAAVVETIDVLESFGWGVSRSKILCGAHSHIVFLGLRVEIVNGELRIPQSKADKLGRLCREAAAKERVTLPELQAITGLLNFLSVAVPVIGAMTRALYGCLAEAEGSPGRHVWRRGLLDAELRWWSARATTLTEWKGRVRCGDGDGAVTLVTDASADGVGGIAWRGPVCPELGEWVRATRHLMSTTQKPSSEAEKAKANPSAVFQSTTAPAARAEPVSEKKALLWPWLMAGRLSELDRLESSAVRELQALVQSLQNLERDEWFARPTVLVWYSDSTAATRALIKWRSKSTRLSALLTEVWETCCRLHLEIRPHWISRDSGWLPGADWLSRVVGRRRQAEWSVSPARVREVVRELDAPVLELDAFASATNAQAPRFRSRWPERGSEGQSFGDPWRVPTWAFPPFGMVTQALQFWADGPRAPLVIVVPMDARSELGLQLARRDGSIHGATAPWREPLIDVDGSTAPGDGPVLRAFLLKAGPSGRPHRTEAAQSATSDAPTAARPQKRPGPLK
jgi:hypothetical protein